MKISNLLVFSLLVSPVFGGCGEEGSSPDDAGTADAGAQDAGTDELPGSDGGTPASNTCNADTCANGCCIAGFCYRNQSDYGCGSLGGTCAMCQVIQSCQKEDAARGWECLTDRSTEWVLRPVSATIPPNKPNGTSWDPVNPTPEVVVILGCPLNGAVTQVKTEESSSLTPTFTQGLCTTIVPELLKEPVTLKVVDVDFFGLTEEIATARYTFTEDDFRKGTINVPISSDEAYSLTLQLTRRE